MGNGVVSVRVEARSAYGRSPRYQAARLNSTTIIPLATMVFLHLPTKANRHVPPKDAGCSVQAAPIRAPARRRFDIPKRGAR